MLKRLSKAAATLAITASLLAGPLFAQPAAASTGSTYTIIESALALIGGIILYNNYQHKKQAASQVVGYTRNGGTVYGDGRIVMPDGTTIYPGRNGQYSWGQYAYYSPRANGYTYDYSHTGRYDTTGRHGHHYGWRNGRGHHARHHGDNDGDGGDRD